MASAPGPQVVNGLAPVVTVIFFRAEGWYPMEVPIDADLAAHARCNPGTIRIEDLGGRILWPPTKMN